LIILGSKILGQRILGLIILGSRILGQRILRLIILGSRILGQRILSKSVAYKRDAWTQQKKRRGGGS
jgi:hypothetical protein